MYDANSAGFQSRARDYVILFLVLGVYVAMRVLVWQKMTFLEDQDSVGLLSWAVPFYELNIRGIVGLDPDASLVTPFLTAVFSAPGWSLETGARLASLVSSVILFLAIFGIGREITGSSALMIGLLLLAFNPEIVPLSVAVLTEPSYVATVYVGLLLFWLQFRNPTFSGAVLLGLIFGLAFLNRLEGILFIAFVPLMLGLYYVWYRPNNLSLARLLGWIALFTGVFAVLIGLQVWRVSNEMGALAINGRQAWTLLLHSSTVGDNYLEKIYGLYFDPGMVNIDYVTNNLGATSSILTEQGSVIDIVTNYAVTFIKNLYDLYLQRLNVLFGPLVLIFFAFGLLHLYTVGRRYEVVLIIMFIAFALVAPLLHNVVIRHIMVIAPIMLLVAGIGVVVTGRALCKQTCAREGLGAALVTGGITLAVIAGWALPLRTALNPPETNPQNLVELREPIRLIAEAVAERPQDRPRVIARWVFLTNHAGAEWTRMPYTDYTGLVKYSTLNNVDFLYLNHQSDRFPFADVLVAGEESEHFVLVYRGTDSEGAPTALYRFNPDP